MAKRVKLNVIPPPPSEGSKTIFATHDKDSLVKGIELDTYTCGKCEFACLDKF